MTMRGWWVLAAAVMVASPAARAATPGSPARPRSIVAKPEDAAQIAAEKWLAFVDAAKFGEAWDASAKTFRTSVPREEFTKGAGGQHGQLGSLVSRKVQSRTPQKKLPNAPPGDYMVVEFATDFTQEKTIETVALTPEAGVWRVSGYQVSPR
jgi:hypothetical protein